jgi:hypothetical protein
MVQLFQMVELGIDLLEVPLDLNDVFDIWLLLLAFEQSLLPQEKFRYPGHWVSPKYRPRSYVREFNPVRSAVFPGRKTALPS